MKKIISFSVAAAMVCYSLSAQTMKVTKTDGTLFEFHTDEIKSVVFEDAGDDIFENGHEYVDLGLPSGTLWAKCNVGATSPEQAGGYYSWGEVAEKESYTLFNYAYGQGEAAAAESESYDKLVSITKYNTDPQYGTPDYKDVLDPEDDAAHVIMGGRWRMPTKDDRDELLTNCTCQITKINDVRCMKFTGPNGNYILLPCVGLKYNTVNMFNDVAMKWGFYWTSSLCLYDCGLAEYLYSEGSAGLGKQGQSFRYYGQSVRAVFTKATR